MGGRTVNHPRTETLKTQEPAPKHQSTNEPTNQVPVRSQVLSLGAAEREALRPLCRRIDGRQLGIAQLLPDETLRVCGGGIDPAPQPRIRPPQPCHHAPRARIVLPYAD